MLNCTSVVPAKKNSASYLRAIISSHCTRCTSAGDVNRTLMLMLVISL